MVSETCICQFEVDLSNTFFKNDANSEIFISCCRHSKPVLSPRRYFTAYFE